MRERERERTREREMERENKEQEREGEREQERERERKMERDGEREREREQERERTRERERDLQHQMQNSLELLLVARTSHWHLRQSLPGEIRTRHYCSPPTQTRWKKCPMPSKASFHQSASLPQLFSSYLI